MVEVKTNLDRGPNLRLLETLNKVTDPEIPVLTILDMGIVREINLKEDILEITITPTYSGCPAMNFIEANLKAALEEAGYKDCEIITSLQDPWTTEWISEEGRQKLQDYGIAPPVGSPHQKKLFAKPEVVMCPQCRSENTEQISQFGSTACKAMYKCIDCLEPFDYFKCI